MPTTEATRLRNGHFPKDRGNVEQLLTGEPMTEGYRPTLPLWALYTADTVPQFYLMRDVELMMIHPIVRAALEFYKGGIANVDFWGGPNPQKPNDPEGLPVSPDPTVSAFVMEQCLRFWDRGVPFLQSGYEYGWMAGENLYAQDALSSRLYWDGLLQFSPRDVYLLTRRAKPIGVRVKQVGQTQQELAGGAQSTGVSDLWMASKDVPAKGMWYAHNPRYSQFYGQSQLLGAWRPWRRLAWKDGAEGNIDLGFYRHWCRGPIVEYPNEDFQAGANAPAMATTLDSQGRPRRYARDFARQLAEWYKAGAGVGFPSDSYPPELGGGKKWTLTLPDSTLDVDSGINYAKYLHDMIRSGVGVPPELLEPSESGGGFNGRQIPLYAFLEQQQKIADAFLLLFVRQVLIPLVRWNFGEVPWQVQVKPLIVTRFQGQRGEASQPANGMGAPATGARGGERAVPESPTLPQPPQAGPVVQESMDNVGGWSLEQRHGYETKRREMAEALAKKLLQRKVA